MLTIQTSDDLWALEPPVCPEPLRRFLSGLLQDLEAEVDLDDREEHLHRNPIILCERGDYLSAIIVASPFGHEYVEKIDMNGVAAYRVGILLDNDSFAQYVIAADNMDAETEQWMKEYCAATGDGER
ncbi:hypothetical protein M5X11_08060 [Paenibacillus alginolyticus]|uniref:hypothetical protein n=1 Tax=Paenibacillus alginolyticus TaxID=59839 RepID=UPI000414796C|nr:hypothetical protein [Paenibacillus alginolyticus]MCY9664911.1 hypothetical protein [Paenibacillus alginolyticus]